MAKIRKQGDSPIFKALHDESKAVGDRADCTVKALAILTDKPYAEVSAVFEAAGRKRGCGADWSVIHRAAKILGYKLVLRSKVEPNWQHKLIDSYPGAHKNLLNLTSHHPVRFKKAWANQPDMMLDFKASHVAAYKDGRVHDWTEGRAKRLDDAFLLVPLEVAPAPEPEPVKRGKDRPSYNDPEALGYYDASRGHTACPYGIASDVTAWHNGYSRAETDGVAVKSRFAKRKK